MSALPLASAASRCAGRRLTATAAAHPRTSAVAAAAAVLVVAVGVRAGAALADVLEPTLTDPAVTRALAVGIALMGLGTGTALGFVLPGQSGLGGQLGAAPASAVDRAFAVLGPPAALVVVGASIATLPLALPVAASSAGGVGSVPALVGVLVAAIATGGMAAALARAFHAAARPVVTALAVVVAGGVGGLGVVALLRTGDALAGEASTLGSAAQATLAAMAALLVWGCALLAPERPLAPPTRSRLLRGGSGLVAVCAAGLLLLRRGDLRAALVGAMLLGLIGIAVARLGEAPSPSGLLLGTTGAALTAAPFALAVGGIVDDGRHLWRLAPVPVGQLALAWTTAAVVGLGPPLAVAMTAHVVEGGRVVDLGVALGLAVVVWACALVAGALVPWRRHGVADQALSLGVLGVGLGGVSLAASRLGPLLVEGGAPPSVAGALLVGATVALALTVLGLRLGRGR